jgi:cell division inhibitor SulA/protein ImuA
VEILIAGSGFGELSLWAPLVAQLTCSATARWCTFVTPPFEPFAPAWRARGARLDRLLVVRTPQPLWALEQSLLSGACGIGFAWPQRASMTELRRLTLATERSASLGVLIRPSRAASEHSAAVLRIAITRTATHLRLKLLKGRGLSPCAVELAWP